MIAMLDRLSLVGMALGAAMMLQPWLGAGFQIGFFVVICGTILQIVTSHLPHHGFPTRVGRPRTG